jgi:hypothetical protein
MASFRPRALDEALELVRDHPLPAAGPEYTIELFETPRK